MLVIAGNNMKADAVKIADNVYWVGVLDWDIRTYHGYTLHGTTYNAYLIFGEDRTALVDNTYPGTSAQMWARIQDACQKEGRPFSIDVVIQNHIELDHSGALTEIHKRFPAAPIYITEVGAKGLKKHYASLEGVPFTTVKTGDELALGGKTCTFLEAPLLHWPDSMFTFLKEDGILFSNDAFSQHLCLAQRYDADVPEYVLMQAAQKFFANLITPLVPLCAQEIGRSQNARIARQDTSDRAFSRTDMDRSSQDHQRLHGLGHGQSEEQGHDRVRHHASLYAKDGARARRGAHRRGG